ncbi:MAG: hypothetical protein Q8O40_16640 [Chloroflexota bacterium]|nr:hypothetical protein [Chloroflexota bacterium]
MLTVLLGVIWSQASSIMAVGPITAYIIVGIQCALYLGYTLRYRDGLIARLFLFSIAAGLTELLADRWLVEQTGSLLYNPSGPFLMQSPFYMPLAWALILIPLGYLAIQLGGYVSLPWATALTAVGAAAYIPLYEHWAIDARWWSYRNATMIGGVPWYIIVGELLSVLPLPLFLARVDRTRAWTIGFLGILEGLWIWGAYAVSYGGIPK